MQRRRSVSRFSRAPSASRPTVQAPKATTTRTGTLAAPGGPTDARLVTEPVFEFANKLFHKKRELTSFANLLIHPGTREIDVSSNLITDFNGLPGLKDLETLNVANNRIESFQGFPHFTHLAKITVTGNPVAKNDYHRIALLMICPTLKVINGEYVSPNEMKIVKEYPKECVALVRAGWQIKYPPPKPGDLPKLKKGIAKSVAVRREPTKVSAAPRVLGRPKKQSSVFKEMLSVQEAEMRALTQQMDKISGC